MLAVFGVGFSGCVVESVPLGPEYVTVVNGDLVVHTVCDFPIKSARVVDATTGADVAPTRWEARLGPGELAKATLVLNQPNPGYVETMAWGASPVAIKIAVMLDTAGYKSMLATSFDARALTPGKAATPRGIVDESVVRGHPEFLHWTCPTASKT